MRSQRNTEGAGQRGVHQSRYAKSSTSIDPEWESIFELGPHQSHFSNQWWPKMQCAISHPYSDLCFNGNSTVSRIVFFAPSSPPTSSHSTFGIFGAPTSAARCSLTLSKAVWMWHFLTNPHTAAKPVDNICWSILVQHCSCWLPFGTSSIAIPVNDDASELGVKVCEQPCCCPPAVGMCFHPSGDCVSLDPPDNNHSIKSCQDIEL